MTTLREAAQQALRALGKWSSGRDMDAVELNDLIATLEAALEQPEEGRLQFSVQETVCAQCGSTNGAHSHGCPVARTALEQPEQEPATSKDSLQVGQEEPEGGWQSAPSPQVTQRIADMPMSEYRRGVNDGFTLGLREGRIKAEDEMMVGPIEPTRRMIEAGAQRLVSREDGSVWPDSWDALQVAAARNDAERVWRSMRAEAPKHVPRREWRGLTEEEMHGLYRRAGLEAYYPRDGVVQYEYERRLDAHARAIESALKEKNNG